MSNYIYKDDEIYHFGVKGMKWGVRKVKKDDENLSPEERLSRLEEQNKKEQNKKIAKGVAKAAVAAAAIGSTAYVAASTLPVVAAGAAIVGELALLPVNILLFAGGNTGIHPISWFK